MKVDQIMAANLAVMRAMFQRLGMSPAVAIVLVDTKHIISLRYWQNFLLLGASPLSTPYADQAVLPKAIL